MTERHCSAGAAAEADRPAVAADLVVPGPGRADSPTDPHRCRRTVGGRASLTVGGAQVGVTVEFYRRKYMLTDADPFTREFYATTLASPLKVRPAATAQCCCRRRRWCSSSQRQIGTAAAGGLR